MTVAKFAKVTLERFQKDYEDLLGLDSNVDLKAVLEDISLPRRATHQSAGYDFVLPVDVSLKPGESMRIPTGIRCYMEEGYVLKIFPRSSLGLKYQMGLLNTVGIIDADYYEALNEGHIIAPIINRSNVTMELKRGERFVQGVFLAYYTAEEELPQDKRVGGFGSSDKRP